MNWKLPNQLTVSRIGLAMIFFVLLGLYQHGAGAEWLLVTAFVVFVIAGVTDFLDGYFARKMKLESAFGRMVDPIVDKVLIVGAFAMLAGSNFMYSGTATSELERSMPHWVTGGMFSVVQAWMVVAILAREFIVSAIRGYSESCGVKFPATYAGKIKMVVQLFAIGTVLFQMALLPEVTWAIYLKIGLVWLAVIVTVISGLAYLDKARKLMILQPTETE